MDLLAIGGMRLTARRPARDQQPGRAARPNLDQSDRHQDGVVEWSGVQLISKPSALWVPPWQLVSAELDGTPLKVATWWTPKDIPDTVAGQTFDCWDSTLKAPGAVRNIAVGQWMGKRIGLTAATSPTNPDANHAKVGVSTGGDHRYAIFGDMNQQGSLDQDASNADDAAAATKTGKKNLCARAQNARGGMFFVVENGALAQSFDSLITDPSGANGQASAALLSPAQISGSLRHGKTKSKFGST